MPPTDRLPLVDDREEVPPSGRDHYDHVVRTRGRVLDLFGALFHRPPAAGRVAALGTYVRYESPLPDASREVAILATARAFDCAYEWAIHAPTARQAGVGDGVVDALAGEAPVATLPEDVAPVVAYARAACDGGEVPAARYRAIRDRFGVDGAVDLTVTVGYYAMLACVLNALAIVPADGPTPF